MSQTRVLPPEEYIEQAYLFRALRERIADGRPAQDVLAGLVHELLSTTKLPLAVAFMLDELKHCGELGPAVARISHYFTPFQAFVFARAEDEESRFSFELALAILEREAQYRAERPSPAGLFVYELEAISRNRLGYAEGLGCMELDPFFNEDWRAYIRLVRSHLGDRDLGELIFARSDHYVATRRQADPGYQPSFAVLFPEKEGKIAKANVGKDPMFLFSTLQRQLGYPEVPRPTAADTQAEQILELSQKLRNLESRVGILEGELSGQVDLSKYLAKDATNKPSPKRSDRS